MVWCNIVKSLWSSDKWFVSPYNFVEDVVKNFKLPEKPIIHDTTLRDGEQQAGIVFRKNEKIEIAMALDEAGVHRIEVGMPAVSKEDFEAIKEISKQGLNAMVMAFVRCLKGDVDLALKCDVPGVVMELPSSKHLLFYAYKWDEEKAIGRAVEAVEYAKSHGLFVTFFTIDATRAELDFFRKVVEAVHNHMDSLTFADTFGVCSPWAISYLINKFREFVKKPIEIHPHNDFGLAVANALTAIVSGAVGIHTTVNGIGERAGNAPLEEVVLALELLLGVKTGVKLNKLYDLSKLVEKYSKVKLPPHKPIVGETPFMIESGIIAEWWLNVKDSKPTEVIPFTPELIGRQKQVELILGKKSGKATIRYELSKLGVSETSEEDVTKILNDVKEKSIEKKAPLTREEFLEIVKKYIRI
uniref:Pyruvate carboxyltransferase n=1 Tax=Ignisphaera aggregans TaxID=334771 RepID=A0A7J3QE25_9CREN